MGEPNGWAAPRAPRRIGLDWNGDDDDDDDDGRRRAEVTCARGEAREARSSARVRRARTRIVVVRRRRRAGGFRSIRVVHSFIPFIHSFIHSFDVRRRYGEYSRANGEERWERVLAPWTNLPREVSWPNSRINS